MINAKIFITTENSTKQHPFIILNPNCNSGADIFLGY